MVKNFQKNNGLTADGIIGKKTMNKMSEVFGITNIAEFLGQLHHESGGFKIRRENLNYSAPRLTQVFRYFRENPSAAPTYANNPEKLGNFVYANRMGNNSKNGYLYRGNGSIQLTGYDNHKAFSEWVNDSEVITRPDVVCEKYYFECAVWFWKTNKLNGVKDVKTLTKRINGGYNGLEDRIIQTNKYKNLL